MRVLRMCWLVVLLLPVILSCAGCTPPPLPTPTAEKTPRIPTATQPQPTLLPLPSAIPAQDTDASLTPEAQYRLWMKQARDLHPYAETVDQMWAVMICESSGNPGIVADTYYGLFQYHPDTWSGEWNPYRDQPILDARAQIFATAKAWQDGHQGWWGCYR